MQNGFCNPWALEEAPTKPFKRRHEQKITMRIRDVPTEKLRVFWKGGLIEPNEPRGPAFLGSICDSTQAPPRSIKWNMLWRLRSFPDFVEPCLPSPIERPPAGPNWIHEIKHD